MTRPLYILNNVIKEDMVPEKDRAPSLVYVETLHVPRLWWVVLLTGTAVFLVVDITVNAQWWAWIIVVAVPLVTGWIFYSLGQARIKVNTDGQGGGTLHAGGASLPFDAISRCAIVPKTAKQAAMGRQLDPEAYVVHRGYIPTMLIIVLDDPQDPTPYWLISTRNPERLKSALPDFEFS